MKEFNETELIKVRNIGSLIENLAFVRDFFKRNILASLVPSDEIYRLIEELLEVLQFVVSHEHYRSKKAVPVLKIRREPIREQKVLTRTYNKHGDKVHYVSSKSLWVPIVDEMGNDNIVKIHNQSIPAQPDPVEIEALQEMQKILINLRRNRAVARPFPTIPFTGLKETMVKSSKRQKQRKKRKKKWGGFYK